MASELGLGGRVRFVGTFPFAELFDRLHGATALVQPSVVAADGDCEGAPMVLMHAQAGGVPCVTTAHAGNPEVLPPEAQRFVVPERDPAALARAMAAMAAPAPPPGPRSRRRAGRGSSDTTTWSRPAKAYADLYGELCRANSRASSQRRLPHDRTIRT